MSDLIDLFDSRAQSRLLQTLSQQFESLPLRQLADLSEVPIFSTQRAVKSLLKQKVILEKRQANQRLLKLNPESEHHHLLREIFKRTIEFKIKTQADAYQNKATQVLEFTQSALDLIKHARKSKK